MSKSRKRVSIDELPAVLESLTFLWASRTALHKRVRRIVSRNPKTAWHLGFSCCWLIAG